MTAQLCSPPHETWRCNLARPCTHAPTPASPQVCTPQLKCTASHGSWKSYPPGNYWDTCSSIYWDSNDYVILTANCENGGGGDNYNELHMPKCCRQVTAVLCACPYNAVSHTGRCQ